MIQLPLSVKYPKKKQAINNLFQAIENGLNAEITTDRINTLQDEIKALELSLEQSMKQNDTVIDREKLIQSLLEDAKKIDLDFEHRRYHSQVCSRNRNHR